ncbi:MAG: hypothetical protein GKR93_02385 [Gammaproteobacteria bacterium]|nr:hypothetical protein [Gammaproteobacteria bacterium]
MTEMDELEIVGVVKSKPLRLSRKTAKHLRKHLSHIGWRFGFLLFWQQIIQMLGYTASILLPDKPGKILPVWKIGQKHQIPVHRVADVNHPDTLKVIEALQPDIIVSAYFNQIIRQDLIAIPATGILNIHPGWLPAYRGVMAYFWVLKNGSEKAGVSVHWIDKGIDTGELVARHGFRIREGMTQQKVLIHTAVIGSVLLERIARLILKGQKLKAISIEDEEVQYYSMPTGDEFDEYFKSRRFFRIRDMFGFLFLRRNKDQ